MNTGFFKIVWQHFLSGKNEGVSQFPAHKINTLKADISPSFGLQTLLSLLKIQCNKCSKKNALSVHTIPLDKTQAKLFIKHFTTQLTSGYYHI